VLPSTQYHVDWRKNPGFDIDDYAGQISDLLNLATRLHT